MNLSLVWPNLQSVKSGDVSHQHTVTTDRLTGRQRDVPRAVVLRGLVKLRTCGVWTSTRDRTTTAACIAALCQRQKRFCVVL